VSDAYYETLDGSTIFSARMIDGEVELNTMDGMVRLQPDEQIVGGVMRLHLFELEIDDAPNWTILRRS